MGPLQSGGTFGGFTRHAGGIGDEELINLAVIKSYIHGAAVFNVPSDDLPENEAVAAVLRY